MATPEQRRVRLLAGLLASSGLIACLALAWVILALANFSYGFWHDHGGIGTAIEQWGGGNRYKQAFDTTTREERIRVFAAINVAIHKSGSGLDAIEFNAPGLPPQQLLREPELVHLQDVANLIDVGKGIALVGVIGLAATLWWARRRQWPLPPVRSQLLALAAIAVLILLPVLLLGPTRFFYLLHEWVFPDGHQWFFYYQDSLMSTLMSAPDLFGWIALEWAALAIALFVLLLWVERRLWRQLNQGALRVDLLDKKT